MCSLLNFGIFFVKIIRIINAKKNLIKVKVNGGIVCKTILANGDIPLDKKAAIRIANILKLEEEKDFFILLAIWTI